MRTAHWLIFYFLRPNFRHFSKGRKLANVSYILSVPCELPADPIRMPRSGGLYLSDKNCQAFFNPPCYPERRLCTYIHVLLPSVTAKQTKPLLLVQIEDEFSALISWHGIMKMDYVILMFN